LNNTKGAILKTPNAQTPLPGFGLPDITLEVSTGEDDDGCLCDENAGVCLCGSGAIPPGGCACGGNGCDNGAGLRILSDNVHYLVLGKPFILDLEADGGTVPYAWSMGDGDLPRGLTLSGEGTIEGAPDSPGSFRVTIQVSDSVGKTASKRFTFIVVEDEALAVATDTLPDAQVGLFWTARVRGCGGTKPYAWTVEELPGWLSFDPTSGILSGTPAESAIHDLTVRIKDGEETSDSKLLRLSVYPHDGLTLNTRVLPAPIHGQGYSARLEASGGIPPYVFAPRRGVSLPPGLTLENTGTLSGTPSQKGIYSFVIDVLDGNGLQGSAAYTMVVLDTGTLNPGAGDLPTVREDEKSRQIFLNFTLPKDFNDAEILAVEPLVSPDAAVAGSASTVKKESSGIYKVELTLQVAEQALKSGEKNWKALVNGLVFEGFIARFKDASGEATRFGKALPVKDMKREEEKSGGGGGGCNAAGLSPAAFLPLALRLRRKTKIAWKLKEE
jgi:hypothetical protein